MGTRDDYVAAIKDAFITFGTKSLMGFLIAEAPFFATGIPHYLAEQLIKWVLTTLATLAEMQIFFIYIDVRTSKQGQEFFEAAKKNVEVKKSGNERDRIEAEALLIEKFRAFAKLSN